jgi:branched-chain amino acid transport system ATP-binding protein
VARNVRVTILSFNDVRAGYGPYKALNGLTVSVDAGEALAVLGRNGVGKSTLARVASGLVPVTSGSVDVFGQSIRKVSPSRLARRGVVHLPEGVGLFSGLTIEENLILRVGGRGAAARKARLAAAYEALGPLRDRRKSRAGQLSGGQQRLVAVTGAIAAQPKLLLLDEPALGLSPAAADLVYGALSALQSAETTVVIIETRLGHVDKICHRALIMDAGVAVYDGNIDDARQQMADLLQPTPDASADGQFDFSPSVEAAETSTADGD